MNKTKIVASIGPASNKTEIMKELYQEGMNVVRLNLSHGGYDFCKDVVAKVKAINKELNSNIAVMLDTKGPEIRVGRIDNGEVFLRKGEQIRIFTEDFLGNESKISVNYENFVKVLNVDNIIKLNDGKISLKVIDKGFDFLLCEILNDGVLESYKGVNVPGVALNLPFLSEEDKKDIEFANEIGVDFLALSFVSNAEDVLTVNDLLIDMNNNHMGIIAKIETADAVEDIDNIIRVSDGVMVARGDLGVEVPLEKIPSIQKMILSKCHAAGKISLVATEMLSSMENEARPTRAEVSDVANAVLDGADAIMLSGETTIGKYPVETLEMMRKIVQSTEEDYPYLNFLEEAKNMEKYDVTGSIAYGVVDCVDRLKCKAIVVPTMSGYTARIMSHFRPCSPIIAITPDEGTLKSLSLYFGVHAVLVDDFHSFDEMMKIALETVKKILPVNTGDKIIVTGGYPFKKVKSTNFMKIEEL